MKTGPTYCKFHLDIELRKDVETIEGKETYYVYPCPVCRAEEVQKTRRQLVNRISHLVEYEMEEE
jgi:hypothetical protein